MFAACCGPQDVLNLKAVVWYPKKLGSHVWTPSALTDPPARSSKALEKVETFCFYLGKLGGCGIGVGWSRGSFGGASRDYIRALSFSLALRGPAEDLLDPTEHCWLEVALANVATATLERLIKALI